MARLGICMRNVDDVLTSYLVDVENDDVGEIQFTNNLCEMRRLIKADVISILSVKVAGVPMRVICVHDPKNASKRKVSALDAGGRVVLHGNLIFIGSHMEGEDEVLNPLTEQQLFCVKSHVGLVDIGGDDSKYNTYVMCDVETRK